MTEMLNKSAPFGRQSRWTTVVNLALTILVLAVFFHPQVSRADNQTVKKLLDVGWKVSLDARGDADNLYRKAVAKGALDADLVNAATLVRIRQRQYREAFQSAEQWARIEPSDLGAHQARTWLATMTRDYAKALLYSEAMAKQIALAPEAERVDAAVTLGRIVGYLEAVPLKGVTIEQIRDSALKSERALGASASAFLDARRSVVRKHHALMVRKDATVAEAEAAVAEERQRKLQEIAERKDALQARRGELVENQDRLSSELQKKLDEVNARLRPLNSERARVDAQGQNVNFTLADIVAEIRYLESMLELVRDPLARDRYYREILRLDRLALRYENDAYRLERQAYTLDSQRAGIAADGIASQNRVGAALNRTERELEAVKKQEKRTRIEEKKARKPDRVATRKSRVLQAQIESFTTYSQFPLEREKMRLLEGLK